MNSFGKNLSFTSFGSSHEGGIGVVIDGLPAGLFIDLDFIKSELLNRRGGGKYTTPRKEDDIPLILSGVYKNKSTGAPLAAFVKNKAHKSSDYEGVLRPSHADFTYLAKYENTDLAGGGRASARESVARVFAGAVAKLLLREFGISVEAGLFSVGHEKCKKYDYDFAQKSSIFALDEAAQDLMQKRIALAKKEGNSVGACVALQAKGLFAGLGEPLYDKLSSNLAHALMGINAVKALEFGKGFKSAFMSGSDFNDEFGKIDGKEVFYSNNCGGLLGGLSNGDLLQAKVYFKPTPSIFKPQRCMNTKYENIVHTLKGRHDPCVGVRGVSVVSAMCAFVLADALLANATSKLANLLLIYPKKNC